MCFLNGSPDSPPGRGRGGFLRTENRACCHVQPPTPCLSQEGNAGCCAACTYPCEPRSPPPFDLREAANGQEALTIWQQWQPHLIWMDLRMPVMDGYKATQAIRKLETRNSKLDTDDSQCPVSSVQCRTIIIALSASSMAEELSVALSKGCDDFLRKPFREHEIFGLLHKHLGVQFVYEEGEGQKVKGKGQKAEDALTPEILAALPDDVLAEFRSAVEVVDLDRARCVIDRIRLQNAPLAEALAELVKEFRFDTLQALFAERA